MHSARSNSVDKVKAPAASVGERRSTNGKINSVRPEQIAGNLAMQRSQDYRGLRSQLPPDLRVSRPDSKTEQEASRNHDLLPQSHLNPQGSAWRNASVGVIPGSNGSPLPELVKRDHNASLGGLSHVRVHDDALSYAFTRSIGAKAATLGSHIYFGRNRFDPNTQAGKQLIGHELVHTTQPEAARVVHRSPEDDAVLKQIEGELSSQVITDQRRAELMARRTALAERPKFELLALAQEAEKRKEAQEGGTSTTGMGPSSVTVPLSALIPEPEPLSGEGLFYGLITSPGEAQAKQLAVNYVLDQYLEGKLDWQVKVDLIEPDTSPGVFFNFAVNGQDLVSSSSLDLPLSALDSLSTESLATVSTRATQIVEVSTLYSAFPEIVNKIGTTPENIIQSPEDYARSEADSLMTLASQYNKRLETLLTSLLAGNEWLASQIQNRRTEFGPVLDRVKRSFDAAYKFHRENQPPTYAGETYDRAVRESSGTVERIGWKIWRGLGDLFTLGGQSTQAENVGMYRRGEISRTAYRKNWVLAIGGVAVKAVITALTAGRGTGLAMRFLGLEAGTTAAVVASGSIEGVTTGFAQAFSSDLYAKAVATVSSSPGVVGFHERLIGGPGSWFESAAWGGITGGALSLGSTFLPKTPFDPKSIAAEPTPSVVDAATADVRVLSADLQTGEITLAVRHPVTGELFSAKGNINTGNATVRNLTTGEVVGYIREGEFGPPAAGGELPGKVQVAESGVPGTAETGLASSLHDVLAPTADVKSLPAGPAETFGPPAPETYGPPAPETYGPPAPRQPAAFASGTAPTTAKEVTIFLREFGLEESEIVSFGGTHASRLGPRTAGRVARLAEHFTASDIKALAKFLDKYEIVIDDPMTDMFIRKVEPGTLAENLTALEQSVPYFQDPNLIFDMEDALDLTISTRSARGTGGGVPGPRIEPPWRKAERELGPVLEKLFGSGWEVSPRFQAPGALPGETLGSTVPEYYHPALNKAFEVKRFDLKEMGIGTAGEDLGLTSQATIDALARARRQLAGRQWALPKGAEQNLVFNVSEQGVVNVQAVGLRLRTMLEEQFINYDRVFVQNGSELTEIIIPATQ